MNSWRAKNERGVSDPLGNGKNAECGVLCNKWILSQNRNLVKTPAVLYVH